MNCDYCMKWVNKNCIENKAVYLCGFAVYFLNLTEKYAAVLTRASLKVAHRSSGWLALVA